MSRSCLALLAALLPLATFSGCDKVALTAPTGSTVTLSINTSVVPINGTASVIASVFESAGTPPQNGTVVTFTASFGTITPQEARTEGGKAVVTFTGTQSGKAKIGAFSGSAKATELEVLVGGAAAGAVAVRTEPSSVPQNGGTVQVIALVSDASGNPLPTAPVSFTTDNGTLGSGSAITDASGFAQTSLTTSRETIVTATVFGAIAGKATVKVLSAPTVTITTTTPSAAVGIGVSFTVTPGPVTTGSPIQNVTVDFGDGTGPLVLGAVTGATGVAHTFSRAGSFTVTASIIDTAGQQGTSSVAVIVQRILPNVGITANPTTLKAGETSAFTVTASAGTGGPPVANVQVVIDGAVVFNGTGGGSFTRQFPSPGTYTAVATATDNAGTQATASASVVVTQGAGPTVTLTATPTSVVAGNTIAFAVTAAPATGGPPLTNVQVTLGGAVLFSGTGGGSFTRLFSSPGTFTLIATATDAAGATGSTSTTVVVTGAPAPTVTAVLTFSPINPSVGQSVTFNGSQSTGTPTITSYKFDFFDVPNTTVTLATPTTTHTFAAEGSYLVTLTVTSGVTTASTTVTVVVKP